MTAMRERPPPEPQDQTARLSLLVEFPLTRKAINWIVGAVIAAAGIGYAALNIRERDALAGARPPIQQQFQEPVVGTDSAAE